jgi:hypothetical protein
LEEQLRVMRRQADKYAADPEHDPKKLLKQRSERANLDGAMRCFKRGDAPDIESQAKFLR